MRADPRLFIDHTPFQDDLIIRLSADQSHYLKHVLRCKVGSHVRIFNGQDGEWQALIIEITKQNVIVKPVKQIRLQQPSPEIHLYFAPLKPDPLRFLIEKATELNVSHFHPIQTARTIITSFKPDRLERYIVEASEQCERLTKPYLNKLGTIQQFISRAPKLPSLYIADERRTGNYITEYNITFPLHILIGPEGGFTPEELNRLAKIDNVHFIKLALSILRAETAALTVLSQSQIFL